MRVNYYSRTEGANTGQHGMLGGCRGGRWENAGRMLGGRREDEEKMLIIVEPNNNF